MLSAFCDEVVPFEYILKDLALLLFKCMTYSRLLNILWVPPPCASRKGVKRLQLWHFFSVDVPIPFQVNHHWPVSETPFKWRYGLSLAG